MTKLFTKTKGLVILSLLMASQTSSAQCTVPGSVTASPSVMCAGSTTSLNATSVGSAIRWYTVPSCGVLTGTSASGANFTVSPVNTTTYYAEAFSPAVAGGSVQLNYTGCLQQIIVPAGVTQLTITAIGAAGGSMATTAGGYGTSMAGVFTVTPGNVLNIIVGGQGGNVPASQSSGGGGASGVGIGAVPLIVAGGGGGIDQGCPTCYAGRHAVIANGGVVGGGAGGAAGAAGSDGGDQIYNVVNIARGGRGWNFNNSGSFGQNGQSVVTLTTSGTFGLGGGGGSVGSGNCNCGGGGGGYSGGGAGGINNSGGGGGSYNAGLNQVNTTMVGTGNGTVIILGISGGCTSVSRTPVTVTVNPSPTVSVAGGTAAVCPGSSINYTASGATTYSWSNGAVTSTIAATPTANTTYTVYGTSAGCTGQAVVNASVNPTPTISITGNTLICGTGTNVLTASGGVTYSWSTGAVTSSISVSPSVTTIYTVVGTGTLAGNCSGNKSIAVIVGSIPSVAVTGSGTICAGNSTVLTAGGATSYSWNTGATTNTISVSPTVNTTYTVVGTDSLGCSKTATASIVVSPCTGVNQFAMQGTEFQVYPNPANSELFVELKNGLNKTIEIEDITGRIVLSNTTSKDKVNINIGHLNNGVYYVKVQSNNTVEVIKIVKQ